MFPYQLTPRNLPLSLLIVGSEEAHLAALTSVRLPNWTCRFPASSFHNGEHLLGCKEGMGQVTLSTTESTFLAPSGFLQSASLLGQSGSGFSLRELSSCLTLLFCPSGSFLLPLSVAFPNPTPGCRLLAVERLFTALLRVLFDSPTTLRALLPVDFAVLYQLVPSPRPSMMFLFIKPVHFV